MVLRRAIKYLVELFWGVVPVLQDFSAITAHLLLTEQEARKKRKKDVPDDTRQTLLCHLLLAAAQRVKVDMATKSKNKDTGLGEALNVFVVKNINKLLTTFHSDADKLAALLRIPCNIDLEQFELLRDKKSFGQLLKHVCSAVEKHSSRGLLVAASSLLFFMQSSETSFKGNLHFNV